jgi:hypothetical protein
MSTIDALEQETRARQLNLHAAFERLDLIMAESDPPTADMHAPETRRERELRKAAAAFADHANLYRAAQIAVRREVARRAERALESAS